MTIMIVALRTGNCNVPLNLSLSHYSTTLAIIYANKVTFLVITWLLLSLLSLMIREQASQLLWGHIPTYTTSQFTSPHTHLKPLQQLFTTLVVKAQCVGDILCLL